MCYFILSFVFSVAFSNAIKTVILCSSKSTSCVPEKFALAVSTKSQHFIHNKLIFYYLITSYWKFYAMYSHCLIV